MRLPWRTPMTAVLEIDGLQVAIGEPSSGAMAVNGVSFTVAEGRTTALIGESGSGKSITALAVMRLLPPAAKIAAGRIVFRGDELTALPEAAMREVRGRGIGMIFQEPQSALNPVLSAGVQIGEVLARHRGLRGRRRRAAVVDLLHAVGMPDPERRADDYPHQFSGGMQQRIMIAMAIAAEPAVLIADEPTTALDVSVQASVLALLKDLQARRGTAMLFITHDLAVAAQLAHEVVVLRAGAVVEAGPAAPFFRAPRAPYSQELFAAVPSFARRRALDPAPPARPAVLQVRDLHVHYSIRGRLLERGRLAAVRGASLELAPGRTLAVVGESGSGKSTLGKAILQLVPSSSGSVLWRGRELTALRGRELTALRRELQIVFQNPYASMNPRLPVGEIIDEGMRLLGAGGDRVRRAALREALFERVGLPPAWLERYPHEFSGGQRQRVCIARALAVRPGLLVLDEPTSSLDPSVQAQILALLRDLQRELDLAYLFITHNIGVVEYFADSVAVMAQGRVVEQGPVEEVLTRPRDLCTQALLRAVPRLAA